jgi:hypothetical protein
MRGFDRIEGSGRLYDALTTKRFRMLYLDDLTNIIDSGLAGPFLEIDRNGNCDYIFRESRIIGVREADDFLRDCRMLAEAYRNSVQNQEPLDNLEQEDKKMLLEQAELIESLSYLAHSIILKRHQREV